VAPPDARSEREVAADREGEVGLHLEARHDLVAAHAVDPHVEPAEPASDREAELDALVESEARAREGEQVEPEGSRGVAIRVRPRAPAGADLSTEPEPLDADGERERGRDAGHEAELSVAVSRERAVEVRVERRAAAQRELPDDRSR